MASLSFLSAALVTMIMACCWSGVVVRLSVSGLKSEQKRLCS